MRGLSTFVLLVLLISGGRGLLGQAAQPEAKRRLSGSLSLGWLDSYAREIFQERRRNPFTSLRLDYQSYFLDPDFFSYRIQPRLSSGFQDAFTGLSDGTGVAIETDFLRRRPWPFRFRYARFRRMGWTSGINGGYGAYSTRNNDSSLGFQWQLLLPNLPKLDVNFNKSAVMTSPELILAQGFETRSDTFSLSGRDTRLGWELSGGATLQGLDNRYVLGSEEGALPVDVNSKMRSFNFTGARPLVSNLTLTALYNKTGYTSEFDRGVYAQDFDSASLKLDYRPPGRLKAWTQARLTHSKLESTPLQDPDFPGVILPPMDTTNGMWDSEVRFEFPSGVSLFGRSELTRVSTSDETGLTSPGDFLTLGGGARVAKNLRQLDYTVSYYAYSTRTRYQTLDPQNLIGQGVDASVSAGDPSTVRVTGAVMLNRSDQEVRGLFPYASRSRRYQALLSRKWFRRWSIELHGGVVETSFTRQPILASDFRGWDYGINLSASRYSAGYSRSTGSGSSYQRDLGPSPLMDPRLLVPGVFFSEASSSVTLLHAHWNMTGRMLLRGVYREQVQRIAGITNSKFEQQEATYNYQYRKLRFEAGMVLYRYNFGSPIIRRSLVFRVTRDFQVF